MTIGFINGPNLNLLGTREPDVYGTTTLGEIEALVREEAQGIGVAIEWHQSNHEGEIVQLIQDLSLSCSALVLNPAGYTHTSMAIRDAVGAVGVPTVELHLTNIQAREPERRRSLVSPSVKGIISGFGPTGYLYALRAAVDLSVSG